MYHHGLHVGSVEPPLGFLPTSVHASTFGYQSQWAFCLDTARAEHLLPTTRDDTQTHRIRLSYPAGRNTFQLGLGNSNRYRDASRQVQERCRCALGCRPSFAAVARFVRVVCTCTLERPLPCELDYFINSIRLLLAPLFGSFPPPPRLHFGGPDSRVDHSFRKVCAEYLFPRR